jgi:transposase
MNFSSETVAFWYGDSKTIPKRRFRRRVGLCRSISGTRSRRRPSAQPRPARGLQWTEVGCVRTGSPWRYMPHDLPPWEAVYQQTRRWLQAGVFEEMVHDLRVLLRLSKGKASEPTAAILDSRTLRSTPESGSRGGYDGAKRKKGSKVHAAVDTLGHLCSPCSSPRLTNRRELG